MGFPFRVFVVFIFHVKPSRAPELIEIHPGEGAKGLDKSIEFLSFQFE
jgi:hypothetical protein